MSEKHLIVVSIYKPKLCKDFEVQPYHQLLNLFSVPKSAWVTLLSDLELTESCEIWSEV